MSLDGCIRASNGAARRAMPGVRITLVKALGGMLIGFCRIRRTLNERTHGGKTNMRQIIVEVEVSIDGAMGGENTDFWKQNYPLHSADVHEYLNDLLFMPDALLMGKKPYELFAEVWPTRQGKD